ncbi:phage tail protein [Roseovarius sp. MMSF_3350]|uniref:phage tail protein n=1 Tax=Roseovarius sp. MMSF_3350 TaxID=3046706 RepID=UPI00273D3DB1|nr:phage tail protein [Roseovarius sp. MMSF_3350]
MKAVIGIGLNKLAAKLAGKKGPSGPSFSVKGELQRGADLPQSYLTGRAGTAGSLVYANSWGQDGSTPNAYLTLVIALSDLPVQGLTGMFVDGSPVTLLDPSEAHPDFGIPISEYRKNVTRTRTETVGTGENAYTVYDEYADSDDYLWVKFYDGTQTQADPFLIEKVSTDERPWGASHVGTGVAYVIVTALLNRDLFNGFPAYMFEVEGVPFYDPSRDSSVGGVGPQRWADPSTWGGDGDHLPAVKIYNLFRGMSFGNDWFYGLQGLSEAQLPVDHWITQIEKCRATVNAQDGDEPRYRSGGEIAVANSVGDAIQAEIDACNGRIAEIGGVFKLFVGGPDAPVKQFSDEDILTTEKKSLTPFFGLADTINGVSGKYPDPGQAYQIETAPPLIRTDLESQDGGRRLLVDVEFDLVPYGEQVQRLMSEGLAESRRARRHTHTFPPEFGVYEPGDVLEWASARNGYESKLFRIDGMADRSNLDVVVDLTEVDPSDNDFDTGQDYQPIDQGSITPPAYAPIPVSDWDVVGWSVPDVGGGGRRPALKLIWAEGTRGVTAISIRVRVKSNGALVYTGTVQDIEPGLLVLSEGILPGVTYEAQARFSPVGSRSAIWSDWIEATAPDIRPTLADLDDSVSDAISDAQQAADDVQDNLDTLTAGFVGTLEDGFDEVRAEAEAGLVAMGPSTLRLPRSLWAREVHQSSATVTKGPLTTGTFHDDDPDFGECFEFGGVYNASLGPAYPLTFDPSKVYKVTVKFKVVNDGSLGPGANVRIGATTQNGTTVVQSNLQSGATTFTIADGTQTMTAYVSGTAAKLTAYDVPAAQQIAFNSSDGATGWHPHIRQNSSASTNGTISVASIEVVDVTEALDALEVARTELSSEIAGVNATLTADHYTSAQADSAISAAVTSLEASIDTDLGFIAGEIDDIIGLQVSGSTAFGTLMSQLEVNAGGTSAKISDFAAVEASVDGFSSAFTGLSASTNGGNITEIRLTSWADPDGSGGSLIQMTGDVLIDGAVKASKLQIGDDTSNMYPDPDMVDPNAYFGGDGIFSSDFQFVSNDEDEAGSALNYLQINSGDNVGTAFCPPIKVEGGKRYNVSATMETAGSGNAFAQFEVRWYGGADATNILRTDVIGDTNATNWEKFEDVLTAPANAKRARFLFSQTLAANTRSARFSSPEMRRVIDKSLVGVGSGVNLIDNSDFQQDTLHWRTQTSGTIGSDASFRLRQAGEGWTGADQPVLEIVCHADNTGGGYAEWQATPSRPEGGSLLGYLLNGDTDYVEVSAQISAHRCWFRVNVYWYSADGTYIGQTTVEDNSDEQQFSSSDPDSWDRFGGVVAVPSGARYARPYFRMYRTTSTDAAFLFIHKPVLAVSTKGADFMPYAPRGFTSIDGGIVRTGTLIADRIKLDDITMTSDGSGNLVIKSDGVDRVHVADGAVSDALADSVLGLVSFPTTGTWTELITVATGPVGPSDQWYAHWFGSLNVSGGGGDTHFRMRIKTDGVWSSHHIMSQTVINQPSFWQYRWAATVFGGDLDDIEISVWGNQTSANKLRDIGLKATKVTK